MWDIRDRSQQVRNRDRQQPDPSPSAWAFFEQRYKMWLWDKHAERSRTWCMSLAIERRVLFSLHISRCVCICVCVCPQWLSLTFARRRLLFLPPMRNSLALIGYSSFSLHILFSRDQPLSQHFHQANIRSHPQACLCVRTPQANPLTPQRH